MRPSRETARITGSEFAADAAATSNRNVRSARMVHLLHWTFGIRYLRLGWVRYRRRAWPGRRRNRLRWILGRWSFVARRVHHDDSHVDGHGNINLHGNLDR